MSYFVRQIWSKKSKLSLFCNGVGRSRNETGVQKYSVEVINILKMSLFLFYTINCKRNFKKFIRLIPNICQCKVDNFLLLKSTLCITPENMMLRVKHTFFVTDKVLLLLLLLLLFLFCTKKLIFWSRIYNIKLLIE